MAEYANRNFKWNLSSSMAEYANHNFKWNLPSSMAEYANHNFKTYIANNDIEEQLITQKPVFSNFQQVKPPDDFI